MTKRRVIVLRIEAEGKAPDAIDLRDSIRAALLHYRTRVVNVEVVDDGIGR